MKTFQAAFKPFFGGETYVLTFFQTVLKRLWKKLNLFRWGESEVMVQH